MDMMSKRRFTALMGRYVPEGSVEVKEGELDAVVYTYERVKDGRTEFLAIAYSGKANKNRFHINFRSEARRAEHVAEFFAGVKAREVYMAERSAEKKNFVHSVKVGDIMHYSWGYDQTNNNFYEVIEVKGKSVVIHEIAATYRENGFMSGYSKAIPGKFLENKKPMLKRVGVGNYIKMEHSTASVWSGREVYESSYA